MIGDAGKVGATRKSSEIEANPMPIPVHAAAEQPDEAEGILALVSGLVRIDKLNKFEAQTNKFKIVCPHLEVANAIEVGTQVTTPSPLPPPAAKETHENKEVKESTRELVPFC